MALAVFLKRKIKAKRRKLTAATNSSNSGNDSNSGNSSSAKSNSKFDFEPRNKVLYFDNFELLSIGIFLIEFNTNASNNIKPESGAVLKEIISTLQENATVRVK